MWHFNIIFHIWLINLFFHAAATLLKKRFWYRCFSVNFKNFSRNVFFYRTPLGDNFCKSMWPYVQHICWIAKLWLCFLNICLYVVLVSFISVDLLILNSWRIKCSRKFSFAVMENFDAELIASLLNEESTIEETS